LPFSRTAAALASLVALPPSRPKAAARGFFDTMAEQEAVDWKQMQSLSETCIIGAIPLLIPVHLGA